MLIVLNYVAEVHSEVTQINVRAADLDLHIVDGGGDRYVGTHEREGR